LTWEDHGKISALPLLIQAIFFNLDAECPSWPALLFCGAQRGNIVFGKRAPFAKPSDLH
jgi:hypothetical protein